MDEGLPPTVLDSCSTTGSEGANVGKRVGWLLGALAVVTTVVVDEAEDMAGVGSGTATVEAREGTAEGGFVVVVTTTTWGKVGAPVVTTDTVGLAGSSAEGVGACDGLDVGLVAELMLFINETVV